MAKANLATCLEIGSRRVFASAIEWPGWSRSGRDEPAALESLLAYGPRYAHALDSSGLGFQPPSELSAFKIVERLEGNATTDFGAPDIPPSADQLPIDQADVRRFGKLLEATLFRAARRLARAGPRLGDRGSDDRVRPSLILASPRERSLRAEVTGW